MFEWYVDIDWGIDYEQAKTDIKAALAGFQAKFPKEWGTFSIQERQSNVARIFISVMSEEYTNGELYDICLFEEEPPSFQREVPEGFAAFIKALRAERRFNKLIIHDGLPRIAEVNGTLKSGRRYLRKYKFT